MKRGYEGLSTATAAPTQHPAVDEARLAIEQPARDRLLQPSHEMRPEAGPRPRAELVRPAGAVWKLCCCPGHVCTPQTSSPADLKIGALHLTFVVSRDEEYVELRVACGSRSLGLGDRGHNYLLLTLARRRIADAADGVPESECGWLALEDVEHDRTMSPPRLNVDVHRIRMQFAALGVADARGIIERRTRIRRIRIGASRLLIVKV
ncbi:MAG TPA: hypothetical protein VEK07_05775 [Polyangiaceae bacterium]|nr:hypothetical protein [Polyangiaceae bacterium]